MAAVVVSDEVRAALRSGAPVVGLESTIIAHGMPYPENLETALTLERIVRDHGAVPATVAILGGKVKVGLTRAELEHIARAGALISKVSRRDLAAVLASGRDGATTVSATIFACDVAGVRIFATGGIGGVHRGAESTFDESADLTEMSRSSVCVVCAGAKSILDIPRTLERLETLGVSVVTIGQAEFPAFYTRSSGEKSPHSTDSFGDIAAMLSKADQLDLRSGILVAVPVPLEFAADAAKVDQAIAQALIDAEEEGVRGASTTPFLLDRVVKYTDGNALRTNVRLAQNNAAAAAQIAVAYSTSGDAKKTDQGDRFSNEPGQTRADVHEKQILVIGATVLDIYSQPKDATLINGTSNPGVIRRSVGGVGRNIATALMHLGSTSQSVMFLTAVGEDDAGRQALTDLQAQGLSTETVISQSDCPTATYVAVHSADGDLAVAVADTSLYESAPLQAALCDPLLFASIRHVLMDANIHEEEMKAVVTQCRKRQIQLYYEPTSVPKCSKLVRAGGIAAVSWTFPNEAEAVELGMSSLGRRVRSPEEGAQVLLEMGVERVAVTRGSRGVSLFHRSQPSNPIHIDAVKVTTIKNTSGAGDALAAGVIHAKSSGLNDVDALRFAVRVAARSLSGHEAIPMHELSKL